MEVVQLLITHDNMKLYSLSLLLIYSLAIVPCYSADSKDIVSPSQKYILTIVESKSSDPGNISLNEIHGQSTHYPFRGVLLDSYWNDDSSFIAINNRQHSLGGDYIWIFSSLDGTAIKQPDDHLYTQLSNRVIKVFPGRNEHAFRSYVTFTYGWKSRNELLVASILTFSDDFSSVVVCYDVYRVDGHKVSVDSTSIEKVASQDFKSLPKATKNYWGGWKSTWWKTPGTEPSK